LIFAKNTQRRIKRVFYISPLLKIAIPFYFSSFSANASSVIFCEAMNTGIRDEKVILKAHLPPKEAGVRFRPSGGISSAEQAYRRPRQPHQPTNFFAPAKLQTTRSAR